jgi:FkbM family methyltransferase
MSQAQNSPETKRNALPEVFLTMEGGMKVCAPDSLHLITPYVLREQGDWFEDEIKFLRRIVRPGERVVDIGANYGTYTLSLARAVGPEGKVWAFEPATSTAHCLQRSLEAAGFGHVMLQRCALSDQPGRLSLSLNPNSELNALTRAGASSADSEEVAVETLDGMLERLGWDRVDFMKIDAEGEEENILRGGRNFFERFSPLVEFEYKAGAEVNTGLVEAFERLGFRCYRLVPGLDLLMPFPAGTAADGFLLNLFCCKTDCADRLHERGVLVRFEDWEGLKTGAIACKAHHDWRQAMAETPFSRDLLPVWEQALAANPEPDLERALALYFFSRDASEPHGERLAALMQSFEILKSLCAARPVRLRRSTLGRVAREFGCRSEAVAALAAQGGEIANTRKIEAQEPFLPPMAWMDAIDPGAALPNMVFCTILEGMEVFSSFSSFYTGPSALPRLEMIQKLGYGSPEMGRRLELLKRRFAGGAK